MHTFFNATIHSAGGRKPSRLLVDLRIVVHLPSLASAGLDGARNVTSTFREVYTCVCMCMCLLYTYTDQAGQTNAKSR